MTRSPISLLLLFALTMAACTGGGAGGDEAAAPDLRVVFVTHGQASDPFWSVVQNGARQAGHDLRVRVEYQAPESFDMVVMAQLIDAAVASNPDGLVVSMPDVDALGPAVREAINAGISVVTINSGNDVAKALGVLIHVGQTEYEAGYGGGQQMAAAGVTKAFCVNQEVGNLSLDRRCQGFADAMEAAGASVDVLSVELGDPTESKQRIQAALTSNPDVDGLLTLGPTGALPALHALREEGKFGQVTMATFDITPEILAAIEAGEVLFAIDQQQYLQGYLPVVVLALYLRNENTLANDVVRSGPGYVTSENVARLMALTRQGTR